MSERHLDLTGIFPPQIPVEWVVLRHDCHSDTSMKRAARGGAGGKEAGRLLQSSLPNPRCRRRRQSKILLLPVELRSFAAPSRNKPNIPGPPSSVSSTNPDLTPRRPSPLTCRVRSRRFPPTVPVPSPREPEWPPPETQPL